MKEMSYRTSVCDTGEDVLYAYHQAGQKHLQYLQGLLVASKGRLLRQNSHTSCWGGMRKAMGAKKAKSFKLQLAPDPPLTCALHAAWNEALLKSVSALLEPIIKITDLHNG